jgi:transcriptional regulator with XRE-family HTH domain
MNKRLETLKRPEYWFEYSQNELFRQVSAFMNVEGINQTELAERLGVSKGYVSQILNGTSNFSMKKLIEISLAIGKVPLISYEAIESKVKEENGNQKVYEFNMGVNTQPKVIHVAYINDEEIHAA